MRAGWSDTLREYTQRKDSPIRLIAEVREVQDISGLVTYDEWNATTKTGSIAVLATGGVKLSSSGASTISHTTDDGTEANLLTRVPTFDCLFIEWDGSNAENREIQSIVARLDPRADGGQPKTVAYFGAQVFRVHNYIGDGGDVLCIPISREIIVPATGEVAADFTFNFAGTNNWYPIAGPPPYEGANRPQTVIRIVAMKDDGTDADNVAWLADSAESDGTITGSGYTVTRRTMASAGDQGNSGGTVWQLGAVGTDMLRFTLNRASYSAGSVEETGITAPSGSGGDLVIRAFGILPADSALTFEIDDGGGAVECFDGDRIGEDNTTLGGADLSGVSTSGPWTLNVDLDPSTDNFNTPTVTEFAIERVSTTSLAGVCDIEGGRRLVDPVTLKGNIPEATIKIRKTGEKDYADYGSEILTASHIGAMTVYVWAGDPTEVHVPRRQWMLLSVWDVDDIYSTETDHVVVCRSPLKRLRTQIPKFTVTSGTDGTRTAIDYSDDIKGVYEDLLDTQAALPGRFRGPGLEDGTTQIAKRIADVVDLKDELDRVAYLMEDGHSVIESQGRIKAVPVMRADVTDTPVAHFPLGTYSPVFIGPGFSGRIDEFFVRHTWNETREQFEAESRFVNAVAFGKLGAGLDTTQLLDEEICKWIPSDTLAEVIGPRVPKHFGAGLIVWEIQAFDPNPHIEIGDVVTIEVDQFVARSPINDERVRGRLFAQAIVIDVGDHWCRQLSLWVPSWEAILPSIGSGTLESFGYPQIAADLIALPVIESGEQGYRFQISYTASDFATHVRVVTHFDFVNTTGPGSGPFSPATEYAVGTGGTGLIDLGFWPTRGAEQYYSSFWIDIRSQIGTGSSAPSSDWLTIYPPDPAGTGELIYSRPRVSMDEFGIVGNTGADEYTELQDALDEAAAAGQLVELVSGRTYIVETGLVIPANSGFVADGMEETVIKAGADSMGFLVTMSDGGILNNITLDGDSRRTGVDGIYIGEDCGRCKLSFVRVRDVAGHALLMDETFDNHFFSIHAEDCGASGRPVLRIQSTDTGATSNQNFFYGVQMQGGYSDQISIDEYSFANHFFGVHLEWFASDSNKQTFKNIDCAGYRNGFFGVHTDQGTHGFNITGPDNHLVHCFSFNQLTWGFLISGADAIRNVVTGGRHNGYKVENASIDPAGNKLIGVASEGRNCHISAAEDTQIRGGSIDGASGAPALTVNNTSPRTTIDGVRITPVSGQKAIVLAAADNPKVINNVITTAGSPANAIDGSGANDGVYMGNTMLGSVKIIAGGSGAILRDNDGYVSQNEGAETTDGDGSTSYSWAHGLDVTPEFVEITPGSADARGLFYATADGTNITVAYASAPPSGSGNLKWFWSAGLSHRRP